MMSVTNSVITLALLGTMELSIPMHVRQWGLDKFPQAPADVKIYRAEVGYFRFPRTAFLVACVVSAALLETDGLRPIAIGSVFVFFFAWFATMIFDIFRARGNWWARARLEIPK